MASSRRTTRRGFEAGARVADGATAGGADVVDEEAGAGDVFARPRLIEFRHASSEQ